MKSIIIAAGVALLATSSTSATECSSGSQAKAAKSSIVETAVAAGSFKTLAAALDAADLVTALQGDGPFTVFAPTDDAFAKLPEATLKSLLKPENRAQLASILTFHVVPGSYPAAKVLKSGALSSLNGQRINFSAKGEQAFAGGATIVKTDIECSNGIIHVLDSVILPSSKNLVETATEAQSFTSLLAAATAAGLAGELTNNGPYTIFAPTDAAFAALPAGTVESLLKPENKSKLAAILKAHVASGRVYADQVLGAGSAVALSGDRLSVVAEGGSVRVNGSRIVTTDIDASNGVIHVIDQVILN